MQTLGALEGSCHSAVTQAGCSPFLWWYVCRDKMSCSVCFGGVPNKKAVRARRTEYNCVYEAALMGECVLQERMNPTRRLKILGSVRVGCVLCCGFDCDCDLLVEVETRINNIVEATSI